MMNKIKYFAGIDVQVKRGCSYYIINEKKNFVANGWIEENIPQSFKELFIKISNDHLKEIAIGIDAPWMPVKKLRKRSFDKKTNSWIDNGDEKLGRDRKSVV